MEDGPQKPKAEAVDAVEVKMSTPDSSDGDTEVVPVEGMEASKGRWPSKNRHPMQDNTAAEDLTSGSQKVLDSADVLQEPAAGVPDSQRVSKEAEPPQGETPEKPLSRAERRKKIKEDLMKGSEEGTMGGYRRRMW